MAISRIKALKKRLRKDSNLHIKYTEQTETAISKDCAEAVTKNKIV